MFKCPKCKKFASIGPGTCWKCGATLVSDEPAPDLQPPLDQEPPPDPQPQHIVLRLRPPKRVLFVGCIDGVPELDFLEYLTWDSCIAHFTSYEDAPQRLLALHDRTVGTAKILVEENIDATDLLTCYPAIKFDACVWIGPTNDEDLKETPALVRRFVVSAGKVLVNGGVVFVVQDFKTPNFRPILTIPGAFYCCELQLAGRTKTQHSEKVVKLDERVDHLVGFVYRIAGFLESDTENEEFLQIFTLIMSVPAKKWKGRYSKQEIASLIFGFAQNLD